MSKRLAHLFKFCAVGGMNTVVDFAVFALLIAGGTPVMPAQWLSYGCGVLNSYVWNRNWTFRHAKKRGYSEITRFLAINVAALIVTSLLLQLLAERFAWPITICKLIATSAGFLINFMGSRYWVFGLPERSESE
ncbi:GtrA family protein [Paenibacillus sp. KQZ6P-2]|uniref:GtrA family protein n=1 Tax=Paenibacillus mangrovi TaxID=2931978 RepID=A0A9X1WT12_9BACL|nr:GtrA family protein [Paenibacillus mangrovi]MCJ8014727.1 GtrA family protein [Paenibacillus mangrovi]